MRFVSISAQRVRFVSLLALPLRFMIRGFARLAARFVFNARRVSACGFMRVSSVFHFGAQCVPFGCMTRFFRCTARKVWGLRGLATRFVSVSRGFAFGRAS